MSAITIGEAEGKTQLRVVRRSECLLCGLPGKELYTGLHDWLFGFPGSWSMEKCSTCGLAWLDPQAAEQDIPKLYARYYTHFGNRPTAFQSLRQATVRCALARMGYKVETPREILPLLLSYVPSIARASALDVMGLDAAKAGTLLDVGCGSGEFIERMRSLGWMVAGVDPDPAAVRRGCELGLQIFQGTIGDVPEDRLYDVITLNHVIEHVAQPIALLRDCAKRLNPQTGRLLITTPNINSLGHRWFKRYWRGLEVPRHLSIFSPTALSKCINRAGLHVSSISTETRIARMIFAPSVCAKRGEWDVGERTNFSISTKCASYGFQLLEDGLLYFSKGLGEEIYCVCTVEEQSAR